MGSKKDLGMILAIIFASAAISGSLVFFGMKLGGQGGGDVSDDKIEQAFGNFVKKQQSQQEADQQQAAIQTSAKAKNVRPVSKTEDHIRGNKDAKVSVIEYSDFECPFCKRFHPTTKQIIENYGGKVNLVYRHYPLDFHDPMATKEAEASECVAELAGNDAFWIFADLEYDNTKSGGNGLTLDQVTNFAVQAGADKAKFTACLDSGKYLAKVKADIANGNDSGISGTPGNIIINNETGEVVSIDGAQALGTFQKAIDPMLK